MTYWRQMWGLLEMKTHSNFLTIFFCISSVYSIITTEPNVSVITAWCWKKALLNCLKYKWGEQLIELGKVHIHIQVQVQVRGRTDIGTCADTSTCTGAESRTDIGTCTSSRALVRIFNIAVCSILTLVSNWLTMKLVALQKNCETTASVWSPWKKEREGAWDYPFL